MMLATVASFVPENIAAEIPKPICICLFIKTMYFDCVLIYTLWNKSRLLAGLNKEPIH